MRFLQQSTKVDVGFLAHPTGVTEEELGAIKGPLAIAAAETDGRFPPELRHKSELILQQTGLPYQINLYSGVNHGYVYQEFDSCSRWLTLIVMQICGAR